MSYWLRLKNKETGETIYLPTKHQLKGGTFALGGTNEAELNITYNYTKHFVKVLGEKGIRSIYGLTTNESIPILCKALVQLDNDVSDNYWEATEGNARQALQDLLVLAELAPDDAVWDGD